MFTCAPRTIYLLARLHEPRGLLYHELGHVFDRLVLNGRERRRFKRIAGIKRDGWFQDGLPPSEWFGDDYATCAAHRRVKRGARPTPQGYSPRPRHHARGVPPNPERREATRPPTDPAAGTSAGDRGGTATA